MRDQPFERGEHVFLRHERHLAVELRELRLTVGAQVLVAEAAHQLEIAVEARHHEQLFQRLRRLRQRVELALVHAGGHHEVACPLGRGLDQEGCLHFHEAERIHIVADFDAQTVAHLHIGAHTGAAQVEVAVFHAQLVAAVGIVLYREGRRLGTVEHLQARDLHFDVARGEFGVLVAALQHLAVHPDNAFAPQFPDAAAERGIGLHIEHQLRDAVTVAQIDERHAAQVAATLNPTAKRHGGANVRQAQRAVGMGSIGCFHIYILFLLGYFALP